MSAPVSSPARRRRVPSWLDFRFVLGVVLVLGSVAGGARLFATADRTAPVWALARDLGSGTVLTRADLVVVRVRLPENGGRYLDADRSAPVGRSLSRDVGAGELLPRAAVVDRACGSEVSIPVGALHVPATVRRGTRVDVFATPRGGEPVRVLAAATVQDAVRGSDLGGGSALVVRVADELAPGVVRAVRTAEIDVVLVSGRPSGDGCGVPASPPAAVSSPPAAVSSPPRAGSSPPAAGASPPAVGSSPADADPSPIVPSAPVPAATPPADGGGTADGTGTGDGTGDGGGTGGGGGRPGDGGARWGAGP